MRYLFAAVLILAAGCTFETGEPSGDPIPVVPGVQEDGGVDPDDLLSVVWESMPVADQIQICEAFDLLGPADSYASFVSEMRTQPPSLGAFTRFFNVMC